MAVAFASTSLLLTEPMLRLLGSIWGTADLGATLIVEVTGTVSATAAGMTTRIGIETVTAIVRRVATTGTAVTETRIGTGVIERAPVATRPIAGREEATLAARLGVAPDVLANVNVTVISPEIPVVFCHRPPSPGASHCHFQVIKFRDPLYRTVSRLQTQAVPSISLKTCVICQELWNETMFFKRVQQPTYKPPR